MNDGVAIKLDRNSIHAVVESLPFRGKSLFAWACLNIPHEGHEWYYVSINPSNPGTVDYGMQIISRSMLQRLFTFDPPANDRFWFPVQLTTILPPEPKYGRKAS